jgi:hypothetical protein
MACVLPLSDQICYVRGDTKAIRITVQVFDENASPQLSPLDITGYSFTLTVNTEQDPEGGSPGNGSQLLSIAGVIGSPTSAGVVDFSPAQVDSDALPAPETLYYDIQMIDTALVKRTIAKGEFETIMDITKL